ncbi:VOC family protein [Maricaulis sp.]|uniref:VOC family protein n=1 Tax=Maricaulis sp. TaxID=1486257 RepID=UPI003A9020CB
MIGYVTLGTNRFEEAAAFYDALLAELGAARTMQGESFIAWAGGDAPGISIILPEDGEPATVGNGSMIGLVLDSPQAVDALHARALALGAADAGAPGRRSAHFYAAYFRDLDGHKYLVYCTR